jgi:hypothetical protein
MCVKVDIQDELGESSRILAGSIAGDVVKLHSAEVNVGGDGREHHYHMSSKRKQTRASVHQPSLPCLHLLPATSPHLVPHSPHHSLITALLSPCSSPAAIRDRPPPPPSRSHLGELDLELSNNRAPTSRPPLRHKHKPPTPTQDCLHPIPHSRCHISQANQISISVKSPCRIERNPIAAEVYHQETRDWIEAKGSARLGFAKTKAAPQHLADHTS